MNEQEAINLMKKLGFKEVKNVFRKQMEAVILAKKF